MATEVARLLRGKHKPEFTPNADLGDFVVVVNAEKVKLMGKRAEKKEYFHYTGYPGGAKWERVRICCGSTPDRVFEHGDQRYASAQPARSPDIQEAKVYAGPDHPHVAQQPQSYTV